jgi:hypothetical protein
MGEGKGLEFVAKLELFGLEVAGVVLVGREVNGELLDDLEAVALEADDLARVVGHEPDPADAEVKEDLGAEAVVSEVHGEAELEVGFDGVEALLLELVGVELGWEADAASLLAHVEEDAAAFGFDAGEGGVELASAVAAA